MAELQAWIEALGKIGVTAEGGVFRASYTPEDARAQELVEGWMQDAGLRTRRDAAGNLWGRVEGKATGAAAVATGSHLDSVKNGGNYDGPFGVLGSLMAVRELVRRHGPPVRPLEVVAFTGEEGSRFPLGLMGSRAVAGRLERHLLDEVADERGISVAEAMRQVSLDPDRIHEARRSDVGAYVEMHIEQGPVLESAGVPIGLVRSIVGTQRVFVTVRGRADHAGTTPMHMRRDALVGAARMIARIPELAADAGGVMTVGRIAALPGSTNVVPERAEFTIDSRHQDEDAKLKMIERARAACEEIAAAAGLEMDWRLPAPGAAPVAMSDLIRGLLRESCREQGLEFLEMPSGAGHDAQAMAAICPSGMLFVPCRGGRSHSPEEYASEAAMEAGVAVLMGCLLRLAYG